jgi:CRP-like cAMP-binding protein
MFAGEKIFEEGAIGIEMFFIVSGIVEIFSQHSTSMVKAISDGCYFGDVAVILGGRRTASTQARTNLVLAVIGRNHVVEIINEFPLVQKYMSYIAEKRRLRLESLDPASKLPPLTPEQLKDEEDSLTKYFVKLDKVNDQDKFARTFDAFDASFDAPKTVRRFRPEMRKSKSESCLKLPDEDSPKIVTQPRGSRDNGPNNGRKLKPLVSPTRRPGSRDGDRASNKRRSHSSEGIVRKPYMKESSMTGNGGVGFGGIELKDLPSRVAIGEMKSEPLHSREIEFF